MKYVIYLADRAPIIEADAYSLEFIDNSGGWWVFTKATKKDDDVTYNQEVARFKDKDVLAIKQE